MSCHWTYVEKDKIDRSQLYQGDLLYLTDELKSVLQQYHPHYLKDDYKYFIILTQSCDLVKRSNRPINATYISLAAVRPFDLALRREADKLQPEEFEKKVGICRNNKRSQLIDFVRKLLNNNESEFFYLHEDDHFGLSEPHCAYLRLSIALRASEHYTKCLSAKFIQLNEEFRAKLGWLIGNLFGRIATRDWTPESHLTNIVNEILNKKFVWFEVDTINDFGKHIKKEKIDISKLEPEAIYKLLCEIKSHEKPKKKDAILQCIKDTILASNILLENANIDELLLKISNHPVFSSHIK